MFLQINFFSGEELLVKVGVDDDLAVNTVRGRSEIFEIDEDEELIGCALD